MLVVRNRGDIGALSAAERTNSSHVRRHVVPLIVERRLFVQNKHFSLYETSTWIRLFLPAHFCHSPKLSIAATHSKSSLPPRPFITWAKIQPSKLPAILT